MTRHPDPPPSPSSSPVRSRRSPYPCRVLLPLAVGAALALLTAGAGPGWADATAPASTTDLVAVVDRIRQVIIALSASVATLLLTVGGLRWLLAGGDPGEVDKAKRALTGAAIGYGIALLATVLMGILNFIVSGAADA